MLQSTLGHCMHNIGVSHLIDGKVKLKHMLAGFLARFLCSQHLWSGPRLLCSGPSNFRQFWTIATRSTHGPDHRNPWSRPPILVGVFDVGRCGPDKQGCGPDKQGRGPDHGDVQQPYKWVFFIFIILLFLFRVFLYSIAFTSGLL